MKKTGFLLSVLICACSVMATVSTTSNKVSYSTNGSTTAFDFTFEIYETSDLVVTLRNDTTGEETTLTETTHYSVSATNNDYSSGGTVTTVSTYASGYTLVIQRVLALTQGTDLVENTALPVESLETGFDRLTMICQQLDEQMDRSLKIPVSDSTSLDMELPSSVDRASKFFAWDASGEPIASSGPTGDSAIPVSTYIETLLDDANSSAARTTLGLGSAATAGLSTDGTLASNSDANVPSEKAVKTYVDSGTVTMTNKTLTTPTINDANLADSSSGVAVNSIYDEDAMGSNDANGLATQQSIKAYVDNTFDYYVKLEYTEPNGTDSNTCTASTWNTVNLNTEDTDTSSICTLSSYQATLDAGTYYCKGMATFYNSSGGAARLKLRIRNVTDSTTLADGPHITLSNAEEELQCFVTGRFTVTASKALELQVYPTANTTAVQAIEAGMPEVYAVLEFWKMP